MLRGWGVRIILNPIKDGLFWASPRMAMAPSIIPRKMIIYMKSWHTFSLPCINYKSMKFGDVIIFDDVSNKKC